ncbi:hypothetical protein [Kangiella sp. HZ709]|uniref:hypothetical protein n=1 Tax=Kangiella sp. HZ709 TaxID=2666328 RepID=UPI0012B132DF|nr:hypothetical protein [Kangiella sp. HZ709]MRX27895.1 hypothetical protein [Kangiella sp. HZ709]
MNSFLKCLLILASVFIFTGCEINPVIEKDKRSDFEKVQENAGLVLKDCGKGKVKKVTIDGYECF